MIVDVGKNRIRNWVSAQINSAGLGTDGTDVSATDTGLNGNTNLGTPGTIKTLITSLSDKQIQKEYILSSAEGNGLSYREFGINDGASLFNRIIFTELVKTDAEEWQFTTILRVV